MGEFKKPGGFGGNNRSRGGFGNRGGSGRPSFGRSEGRDDQRSQMFPATCDQCHKQCEVPFRPSGSKPVYCQDCFSSKRESSHDGAGEYPRKEKPPYQSRPHNDFNASLNVPTAPSKDRQIDELKKQLDAVNAKVDKILQLMGHVAPAAAKPSVAPVAVEKKSEPVKVSAPVVKAAAPKAEVKPKKEDKKVAAKKKPVSKKK